MNAYQHSRRQFLVQALVTGGAIGLPIVSGLHRASAQTAESLRIGIIGSGRIGGSVGLRWAEAGHQILFSSRNPDQLEELVAQAGDNARAGYPADAAEFGDVVLVAVPYGANPRADRDGPMADDAIARGTGVASAGYFPGVRLVRAFNALSAQMVQNEAHRQGELIGIPIASDDAQAIAVTERLVRDAGFDPVVVGGLDRAREFDRGTDVYVRGMTANQLRAALGLP